MEHFPEHMAKLPSKAKRGKRRWVGVEFSDASLSRDDALEIARKYVQSERVRLFDLQENPDGTSMLGIIEIKHEDLAAAKVNFGEQKWNELGIKSLTMSGKISLVRERLNIQKPVRKR